MKQLKIALLTNHIHSKLAGTEIYNKNLISLFLNNNYIIEEYITNANLDNGDFQKNTNYKLNYSLVHKNFFSFIWKLFKWKKIIEKIINNHDIIIISGSAELTHLNILNTKKVIYIQHFDQKMYSNEKMDKKKKILKTLLAYLTPLKKKSNFLWSSNNVVFFHRASKPHNSNVVNSYFVLPLFHSMKRKSMIKNKGKVNKNKLVFIGRINESNKKAISLATIFRNVKELKMYGDGNEKNIAKLKIANKHAYMGTFQNENIDNIMSEAKCLLIPSVLEGCPISLLEAAMFGVPTISFGNHSMAHFFSKKGLSIIANNWTDFYQKSIKILNMNELNYNKLSKKVKQKFNILMKNHNFDSEWNHIIKCVLKFSNQ